MKHIYLNLKRFDIPLEFGGVNRIADPADWGQAIVEQTQEGLKEYSGEAEFVMFFPEAHLLSAARAKDNACPVRLGCQSVSRDDTAVGGSFGAFTSCHPAAAAKALGCEQVLVGHCEERRDKAGILKEAGVHSPAAVGRILNAQIRAAQARGLSVLYCVGETQEEKDCWQKTLAQQLEIGLEGTDKEKTVIAYEPVWSIGPGKKPADRSYIEKTVEFIKKETGGLDVVYGGGLKKENATMLAGIDVIDGGLIALTRFEGEIGFYPEEYLEIVRLYLRKQEK